MKNTRERILNQGMELLSQAGTPGVTLGQVAEQLGMSKSGLYAHIRSKDEFLVELLDRSAGLAQQEVVGPALAAPPGLPRLQAIIKLWFGWSRRAGLPGGCPVAAALFELDDLPGPVRDKVLALDAEWRGLLSELTRDAVRHKHLPLYFEVEQFVFELCGIYLSHHVSQRFYRDPEADLRAEKAVQGLLER